MALPRFVDRLDLRTFFSTKLGCAWLLMNGLYGYMAAFAPFQFDDTWAPNWGMVPGALGSMYTAVFVLMTRLEADKAPTDRDRLALRMRLALALGLSFAVIPGTLWIVLGLIAAPLREALTLADVGLVAAYLWGFGLGLPALALLFGGLVPVLGIPLILASVAGIAIVTDLGTQAQTSLLAGLLAPLVLPMWLWGPGFVGLWRVKARG